MNKDIAERTKILLDEANQLFNRLEANISSLGGKTSSFFGILLGIISFQVTLIIIILNSGGKFSNYSYFLLIVFSVSMIISVLLSTYLLRPSDYKDVEVFKEGRFKTLSSCSKEDLLSDFLYQVKKSYENNYDVYNHNVNCLIFLYVFFLLGNFIYILLIISMWIK